MLALFVFLAAFGLAVTGHQLFKKRFLFLLEVFLFLLLFAHVQENDGQS